LGIVASVVAGLFLDAVPKWSRLIGRLATALMPREFEDVIDP